MCLLQPAVVEDEWTHIAHQETVLIPETHERGCWRRHCYRVIVDFSENYNAKYALETQGTHFGASQVQVTLHTGVAYIRDKPVSFATISAS